MRRSRDEPSADGHAPTREAVMQGFAVWRAARPAPPQSPLLWPRRSLLAILTRRRPPDPFRLDDARIEALAAELRQTHPRFEIDETGGEAAPQPDAALLDRLVLIR